jgi:exopolysaccharide biosynthesis polyprenyl glycosylphosphotransferase
MNAHRPDLDPSDSDSVATTTGRVLLVGARRRIRRLAQCLDQSPWDRWPVVGFVDVSGRGRQLVVHPASAPVPVLGRLDELPEVVDRSGATDVVVALSGRPAVRVRPKLKRLNDPSVRVHWVDEADLGRAEVLQKPPAWEVDALPWGFLAGWIAKRSLDIAVSALALLILAPLLLCAAILILVTTGRPIFYTQLRIGRGGRPFAIWKFRSMRPDAESETGPIWASYHDTRCTRVGDWLRRTNIDELPQLWNVLRGDMSLVGPRPERPIFVEQFREQLPDYDYRHAVPVGMTGWAQVHGWRGRTSLRKRLQYDLDYIRHWSFALDLRVIAMTVQHVAVGKTRWTGGLRWLRRRRFH